MPRRSLRTSTSTQATPQKPATPSSASRRAGRPKSTPQKSQYFKNKESNSKTQDVSESNAEPSSSNASADEDSGWEGEQDGAEPSSSSSEEKEEDYSESDSPRPKKRQKRVPKQQPAVGKSAQKNINDSAKGQELWRPGVKAGLGPGNQLVIDKPKPRSAGKTPYTDDTIHPNTMLFLGELADNNDRQWLKMHDPDYRASWNDFTSFVECLQKRLIEIDETVPELPVKDVFFRIYRDVRFSSDPTPYKAYFSAAWSRTGRKGPYAGYYVQIKPKGGSLVGGGLYQPEANSVARIRREIDLRPNRIKETLKISGIRKEFLAGVGNDDKKVVRAFVDRNSESALKTKPRDYDADHRDIELLRLKSYTIGRKLEDQELLGPKAIVRIAELFSCLEPFITYLNSVVMPDNDSNDSNDSEESGDSS